MRMRAAGQRRHLVQLQRRTTTATATGFGGEWETYARPYAEVRPAVAGQSERTIANTTDATITHLVETDFRTDVRIDHRVLMAEGNALYVVGVPQNVEMRNKTMVIACEERAA